MSSALFVILRIQIYILTAFIDNFLLYKEIKFGFVVNKILGW